MDAVSNVFKVAKAGTALKFRSRTNESLCRTALGNDSSIADGVAPVPPRIRVNVPRELFREQSPSFAALFAAPFAHKGSSAAR